MYMLLYILYKNGSQRILNVIGQFQNLSHFFTGGPRFVWSQCKKPREKHDTVVYIWENPGFTLEICYSYFFHT